MRCRPLKSTLVMAALFAMSATAQAPLDIRVALVIGNSAYAAPAALVNPANDAAAMSGTLKTLGFTVVEVKDGTRSQMKEAVAGVRDRLKGKQGIGMLYYAGHGLQLDWRNYMVPVDAKLNAPADVPAQAIDVETVIEAFKAAGNRMNIVVLDACRDSPFPRAAKGLAPLDAPTGTFLAYATAPGNVAEDGDVGTGNGLYTGYLVKELQKPATRIEDVFKRVRMQVRQKSQGRQIPWESTSLEEDFYFNDGVKYTFRPEDLQRIAAEARQKEEQLKREAEQAKERERQQAAQKALEQLKAAEAERLKELELAAAQAREVERLKRLSAEQAREQALRTETAEWVKIKDSRNADDLYEFLKKFPSGSMSEMARFQLERLAKAQITAQPDKAGVVPLAPGADRFRVGDTFVFRGKDLYGKSISRRYNVTGIDGEHVQVNGGDILWDHMGNLVRNGRHDGVRIPARQAIPAELQLNKKWRSAYMMTYPNGRKNHVYYDYRIVGMETVTVGAGTFTVYKVEGLGFDRHVGLRHNSWIDARTFLLVKEEWRELYYGNTGPEGHILELEHFSRGS